MANKRTSKPKTQRGVTLDYETVEILEQLNVKYGDGTENLSAGIRIAAQLSQKILEIQTTIILKQQNPSSF
jgi:hypothetical protein